jgi:hypothetical protein
LNGTEKKELQYFSTVKSCKNKSAAVLYSNQRMTPTISLFTFQCPAIVVYLAQLNKNAPAHASGPWSHVQITRHVNTCTIVSAQNHKRLKEKYPQPFTDLNSATPLPTGRRTGRVL